MPKHYLLYGVLALAACSQTGVIPTSHGPVDPDAFNEFAVRPTPHRVDKTDSADIEAFEKAVNGLNADYLEPVSVPALLTKALNGAALDTSLNPSDRSILRRAATNLRAQENTARQIESAEQALRQVGRDDPQRLHQVCEAALARMMDGLDDRTAYVSARQVRQMATPTKTGVAGLDLIKIGPDIVVARAEAGTHGLLAGVASGDLLLSIDGTDVRRASIADVTTMLDGSVNRPAILSFTKTDGGAGATVTAPRVPDYLAAIEATVTGRILYLRIRKINISGSIQMAISAATRQTGLAPAGVVLDLRGNQGGILDGSVSFAESFLARGQTILTTIGRGGAAYSVQAKADGPARTLPVVVLVDHATASGAEILAGALQDNGRAIVVGEPTAGIGTIQTFSPLPNNGAMRFTTSRVLLPSGAALSKRGITPDVRLDVTAGQPTRPGQGPTTLLERLRATLDNSRPHPAQTDGLDWPAIEVIRAMQPV